MLKVQTLRTKIENLKWAETIYKKTESTLNIESLVMNQMYVLYEIVEEAKVELSIVTLLPTRSSEYYTDLAEISCAGGKSLRNEMYGISWILVKP